MIKPFIIYLIRACTNGGTATEDEYLDNLNCAANDITTLRCMLTERGIRLQDVIIISPQLIFSDLYGIVPHAVVMDWCEQILDYAADRCICLFPPDSDTSDGVMQELKYCAEEIDGQAHITVVRDFELAVNFASDWVNQGNKEG